ncbi:MAG: PAS domain-containing protein [Gemmatimonadaceae bacterium]|nr:PAS domain-containing protein [Gemmatimonadaceae bacterium]
MTDETFQEESKAAVLTARPATNDPERLAAVRETGLLDTEVEAAFDRLTRFAVRLVRIPASFISLVDENRDFYKSSCGFGEPLASSREMQGQTFCHFTVQSTEPLVIPDTRADARYRDVPTVQSLGVAAYVGIPLLFESQVIGAFCAIDVVPRNWTAHDVEALSDLAAMAMSEIELRAATRRSDKSRQQLADANTHLVAQRLEVELVNQHLLESATEREALTRALTEQAAAGRAEHVRLNSVLSSISDAFYVLDHEWRFTYVNDQAEQVLLRQRDDLLGRVVWEEFPASVNSTFETQYRLAVESGRVTVFEEFYEPLDTWFEVRAYPGPDGLSVYFQDVTLRHATDAQREASRRRAEDAEAAAVAANAAKSEFLATMSHELRTPLNAILGYTNLLELEISGAINPEQRLHLQRLHTSAEHLLALVNDVLDLSKLEAGEMLLASDLGPASEAVNGTLALATSIADGRAIRLVADVSAAGEVAYVGDEMRVRQILLNLVSNGVKFTEPGGEVHVSTSHATALPATVRLTGDGPWALIAVRDTGIGISAEHQASVFLPFKQIVGGHTRTRGGTGLGLAISRRLARLMGGDITLESVPGRGSTFTLWLPAAGVTNGVTETGQQRSVRARRHAPEHRMRGLTEIGTKLRDEVEQIMEAMVTRVRADVTFGNTSGLSQADLEDHTLSFLANTVQSLIIVDQTGGIESPLMKDGMHIQQFIARSHGAQRARLGWTEAHVASEYAFVEEELAGRIGLLGTEDPDDVTLAIGILARLLMHARTAAITGFRQWRAGNVQSAVVASPV